MFGVCHYDAGKIFIRNIDMTAQKAQISGYDISLLTLEFDPASDGWFLYGYKVEGEAPVIELWHMSEEDAKEQAANDYGVGPGAWSGGVNNEEARKPTLDANGAALSDGDTVTLIKDLDVKGTSTTLKRGTSVKNIRLTDNPEEIDCPSGPIRGLVLKSCFVKKG